MNFLIKEVKEENELSSLVFSSGIILKFFGSTDSFQFFNTETKGSHTGTITAGPTNCNISLDIKSIMNDYHKLQFPGYLLFVKDDFNNNTDNTIQYSIEYVDKSFKFHGITVDPFKTDTLNLFENNKLGDSIIDSSSKDYSLLFSLVMVKFYLCYLHNENKRTYNSITAYVNSLIRFNHKHDFLSIEDNIQKVNSQLNIQDGIEIANTKTAKNQYGKYYEEFLNRNHKVKRLNDSIDISLSYDKYRSSLGKEKNASVNDKVNSSKANASPLNTTINNNIILFGPPGTGKTYYTKYYAVSICTGISIEELEVNYSYDLISEIYNKLFKKERISFVTFHPAYEYEEFIGGIAPKLSSSTISYEYKSGVFKEFCKKAYDFLYPSGYSSTSIDSSEDNQKDNIELSNGDSIELNGRFCFIIDEINRGNIAKIFGELITLIEFTKRIGEPEQILVDLPNCPSGHYFKGLDHFGIPKNVVLLGTMNTADRSIATLDTALRRRFDFIEMMPKPELLKGKVVNGIDLEQLLAKINERIEILYDREHTIGHAFFMKLSSSSVIEELGRIFKNKIIPLLQEYFFNDYEKIRLVLNESDSDTKPFIKKIQNHANLFSNLDLDIPEYSYDVNDDSSFIEKDNYTKIYK